MPKKRSASAQLALNLMAVLARPPVRAGMRLHPERELARRMGLGPKCVHRALEMLTGEGVLSRRHGSGNYVRKIPIVNPGEADAVLAPGEVFPESELCEEEAPRLASLPQHQRLAVQLWSGFHLPDSDNRSLWVKIRGEMEAAGHRLTPCSPFAGHNVLLTPEAMAEQLRAEPADGYLVSSPVGELFLEAHALAFGAARHKILFISLGSLDSHIEPAVRQDGFELILRAIRNFSRQGFRRIAFLGLDFRFHPGEIDSLAYEFAMRIDHLDYRNARLVSMDAGAARRGMLEILDAAEPPEAVFVGNDHLAAGAAAALAERGLKPGRDLAVITISNVDADNHIQVDWTSIELNKDLLGPLAVDALLKSLLVAGTEIRSMSLLGLWRFRGTHLRQR